LSPFQPIQESLCMLRFGDFERLGVGVAALSDKSDGDCSGKAPSTTDRRRFLERCGIAFEHLVCPRQVHGNVIVAAHWEDRGRGAAGPGDAIAEADGVVTNVPGLPLAVTVADCVPLYLYAPEWGAGGIIHAGREGTRQNIGGRAVMFLRECYGVAPEALFALIGPSAGPCCYEVSPESADAFRQAKLPANGRYLDLWASNRRQLEAAGVPSGNIVVSGRCSVCDGAFHSYRANGAAQRNLALIML